jgi:hypothetical protein
MMGMVKGLTAQSLGLVTRWRDREAQMWDVAKKYVRGGEPSLFLSCLPRAS